MMQPLISVAVITYNHENYIGKTIEGALMQRTEFPFEIVISDDCSTDDTRKILLDYQQKYPERIRLILYEKNVGSKANLIANFNSCQGKYIACIEGDDYWTDPEKLQMQAGFMENNPSFSMSFTNINHVDENGKLLREMPLLFEKEIYTHDDLIPQNVPPSLTMMFKKECWPENFPPVFYTIKHSDGFIKAMISQKGPVKYFHKVTGCYRIHSGGMYGGASFEEKNKNMIASFQAILSYFPSPGIRKNTAKAILNLYLKLTYYYLSKGKWSRFISSFSKGFGFAMKYRQLPGIDFISRKAKHKFKKRIP